MEKILTVNDVAGILQVKAITVREMFREKRLRGFKVGKAWRTTEEMLEEDIAALARGESPKTLPEAADEAAHVPTAPNEPTPEPPRPAKAPPKAAPPEKPKAPRSDPAPESDDDDTQQMLF